MHHSDVDDFWQESPDHYLKLHNQMMHEGEESFVKFHGLENEPESWLVENGTPSEIFATITLCPSCGWWSVGKQITLDAPKQIWDLLFKAEGALRSLAIHDINTPLDDIRSYLIARYESRFSIHPRKLEEIVGCVFGNLGYEAVVTAYSNDGGIDVILLSSNGDRIGVQVKRHRHAIEVEQIRSFAGALMFGGFVRGIFVTTSNYRSGAIAAAKQAAKTCVPIELIDAEAFYEALGVAQLKGHDLTADIINRLTSDLLLRLHYVTELHRNSL